MAIAVMPLRTCGKCEEKRVPEGGVEVGQGKWQCAACFRKFFTNKKGK